MKKLCDLGLKKDGDSFLVELPNGTVLDLNLQHGALYVDHRNNPNDDSNGALCIDILVEQ